MSKKKGILNKINGKYSNQSQISDEDRSSLFAYANHIDYVQPKCTKFLSKSRRYYQNKNNFSSNLDFSWKKTLDEEDSEEEDHPLFNTMPQNNDYGHLSQVKDYFQPQEEIQNTPLKRQESQDIELDKLMNEEINDINKSKIIDQTMSGCNIQNKSIQKHINTGNIQNIRIR